MAERKKTIHELFPSYLATTRTKSTFIRWGHAFEKHLDPFCGHKTPDHVYRKDVVTYKELRKAAGAADWTLRTEMTMMICFYNWLHDHEIVEPQHHPWKNVRMPSTPPPLNTALSMEALLALCAVVERDGSFETKLMLSIENQTGLRGETLARLRKSDFDLDRKCLLTRSKDHGVVHVPVHDNLISIIKQLPDGYLVPAAAQRRYPGRYLYERVRRMCKKALGYFPGLQKFRGIHDLRRTFLTDLVRVTDIRTAQAIAGHANIATTARYLTPADTESVRTFLENRPVPSIVFGASSSMPEIS